MVTMIRSQRLETRLPVTIPGRRSKRPSPFNTQVDGWREARSNVLAGGGLVVAKLDAPRRPAGIALPGALGPES